MLSLGRNSAHKLASKSSSEYGIINFLSGLILFLSSLLYVVIRCYNLNLIRLAVLHFNSFAMPLRILSRGTYPILIRLEYPDGDLYPIRMANSALDTPYFILLFSMYLTFSLSAMLVPSTICGFILMPDFLFVNIFFHY